MRIPDHRMDIIQKIAVKYHKHIDGDEAKGMVYFTKEDVWEAMNECWLLLDN